MWLGALIPSVDLDSLVAESLLRKIYDSLK